VPLLLLLRANSMFFIHKDWQDLEDGIEAVLLHWTSTPLEQEPNWQKPHHVMMMIPQSGSAPLRRQCSLWVVPPFTRRLGAGSKNNASGFLLHSFCEIIQRGRAWRMETVSQEMRAVTISHIDPSGECAQGWLYYSLDDLAHINCTPMLLGGLPAKYQFLSPAPVNGGSDKNSKDLTKRYALTARLPQPHTFHGQLWGPRNTRAVYSVYLSRQGAYNPFSEGGFWLFREGRLWEVQL
jgi:hypothetical protein